MGQRLNIEIWNGNKCLANAYYHWSAYTNSAADLVEMILGKIEDRQEQPSVYYAIKLLEATGAGLENDTERNYAIEVCNTDDFAKAINRNEGLIAVTEDGINATRRWEEFRTTVYLDQRRVNFEVIEVYGNQYEWSEYVREFELETEQNMRDLPELDYDVSNILFEDFENFRETIANGNGFFFSPIMQAAIVTIE